jgi:hypothetical protein
MSNRTIIILVMSLLGLGTILGLINLGFFGSNKSNLTIEKGLQDASLQSFDSQNIPDTAKSILQNTITQNNQNEVVKESLEYYEYKSFTKIENLDLLEKYKVDTLLDNTIVYALTREAIGKLGIDAYYRLGYDEKLCLSACTLVKTKDRYLVIDYDVYYLSSFSKNDKIFWIGFIKNADGYVYAKIAEPDFLNPKIVYFTGQNVTKINQKSPNSSEYSFELKNGDSIMVDFKDKNIESTVNTIETQILQDILNEPIGDD